MAVFGDHTGCQFFKDPWKSGKTTLEDLSKSIHSCSKRLQLPRQLGRNFLKKPQRQTNKKPPNKLFPPLGAFFLRNMWTRVIFLFCNKCHLHLFLKSAWFNFFVGFLEKLLGIKYHIKHPFDFRWVCWYFRFCLSLQSHTFSVPYNAILLISLVCWGVLLEDTNNYTLLFTTSVYEKKNGVFCMISYAAVNNVRCLLRNSYKFWLNLQQHTHLNASQYCWKNF